jgi:hypothetical protein
MMAFASLIRVFDRLVVACNVRPAGVQPFRAQLSIFKPVTPKFTTSLVLTAESDYHYYR